MQNVHFTIDDLAKLKIMPTVGPVVEAVFAVDLLKRGAGGAPFATWREAVSRKLHRVRSSTETISVPPRPQNQPPARSLVPAPVQRRPAPQPQSQTPPQSPSQSLERSQHHQRRGSWLFDLVSSDAPPENAECAPDPVIQKVHRLGVAPYWAQMRTHLQLDRDRRCGLLVGGGIESLLSTLHTWIDWRPPVLTVACGRRQEIVLKGNGLVIAPSMFLAQPMVFACPEGSDRPPVLVYPAPLDITTADALWSTAGTGDRALAALVGRTRAKVLQALTETCNTSELGRRLGISPAAASQHATVLREAGLVTSRRRSNTMLHSLTPLGSAMATCGVPSVELAAGEAARQPGRPV